MRLIAALGLLVALGGCERPLVDPLQRPVEVLGLDTDEVRTSPDLTFRLRVDGATALAVDGVAADAEALPGVFTVAARLTPGLNRLGVRASDGTGVVAADTVFVLYLPITTATRALPSARSDAGVAADVGPRVLVTGGIGPSTTALASMAILDPLAGFSAVEVPLLTARTGHTATALPGGGVLLAGGATGETPARLADFVQTAEWIPPGQTQSRPVALPAGTVLRAGHTARALQSGTTTTVYFYGGLAPSGTGVSPSGTVDVFEWQPATERLVRRSPGGGAGAFDAATGHVQLPILDVAGTSGRAADVVFAGTFAARFDFTTPGTTYPFSLDARTARPLLTPRTDAAGAPLAAPGLALVAGGRDAAGTVLASTEIYVASIDRSFRLPARIGLGTARAAAGATLLPDGRIVIAGGRTAAGLLSDAIDIVSP